MNCLEKNIYRTIHKLLAMKIIKIRLTSFLRFLGGIRVLACSPRFFYGFILLWSLQRFLR